MAQTNDTTFLKESLGLRSELVHFDTVLVKRFLQKSSTDECKFIDSLLKSSVEPNYPSEFAWGFSDEFKELITSFSIRNETCIEVTLDNLFSMSSSSTLSNKDDPFRAFPIMNAITKLDSTGYTKLENFLLNSSYRFPAPPIRNGAAHKQFSVLKALMFDFQQAELSTLPERRQKYLLSL